LCAVRVETTMARIFLSVQVSLDGYVAGPDGNLDFTDVVDDEVDELMAEQSRAIDAMIFGHNAYRLLGPYWQDGPTARAVDREHTKLMNSVPKLVLSREEPELFWGPARRIGADLPAEAAALKAGERDVAVFAGAQAAAAMLPFLDELRLLVFPVALGGGLRLFTEPVGPLTLIGSRTFPASGAVQLRYVR
jgi:dihydrofolate reductase